MASPIRSCRGGRAPVRPGDPADLLADDLVLALHRLHPVRAGLARRAARFLPGGRQPVRFLRGALGIGGAALGAVQHGRCRLAVRLGSFQRPGVHRFPPSGPGRAAWRPVLASPVPPSRAPSRKDGPLRPPQPRPAGQPRRWQPGIAGIVQSVMLHRRSRRPARDHAGSPESGAAGKAGAPSQARIAGIIAVPGVG